MISFFCRMTRNCLNTSKATLAIWASWITAKFTTGAMFLLMSISIFHLKLILNAFAFGFSRFYHWFSCFSPGLCNCLLLFVSRVADSENGMGKALDLCQQEVAVIEIYNCIISSITTISIIFFSTYTRATFFFEKQHHLIISSGWPVPSAFGKLRGQRSDSCFEVIFQSNSKSSKFSHNHEHPDQILTRSPKFLCMGVF